MLFFWLYRAAFGVAALAACLFAVRSVLRHHRTLSFYLTLSGIITLILFLVVPDTPAELIMISLLAVATGALLMPSENQRSTHELLDDDIEIGDSTATRRLRK
ncbi:MAG: hypothetical protein ACXW3E_02310 [Thermoanaerobaculia bacterium]